MLNVIKLRLAQLSEFVRSRQARSRGWASILWEMIYQRHTAIIVEKDLSEVTVRREPLARANLEIVEITSDLLSSGAYRFALPSRYQRALNHLRRGHGGHALARDGVLVGDTWYYGPEAIANPRVMQSLRRLGFDTWDKNHVFTLDIFVVPEERKGGVSAAFQNGVMLALRAKGYSKAFGVYFADDLAAYWCTRVTNKWNEVHAATVTRVLLFATFTKRVPLHRVARGAQAIRSEGKPVSRVAEASPSRTSAHAGGR